MASIKYKSDEKKAGIGVAAVQAKGGSRKWLDWPMLPKLMGGFFSAIFGLMVAVVFFSYGDEKIVSIAALQSKCHGFSDSHSVVAQRSSLYTACIRQGFLFSSLSAQTPMR